MTVLDDMIYFDLLSTLRVQQKYLYNTYLESNK